MNTGASTVVQTSSHSFPLVLGLIRGYVGGQTGPLGDFQVEHGTAYSLDFRYSNIILIHLKMRRYLVYKSSSENRSHHNRLY